MSLNLSYCSFFIVNTFCDKRILVIISYKFLVHTYINSQANNK